VTQVPLDWLDLSLSQLVTIAIIRYNATDRTNYQWPILINTGGLSGLGIWVIKHLAPYYQSIVEKSHVILPFLLVAWKQLTRGAGHHILRPSRHRRNSSVCLLLELHLYIQHPLSSLEPSRTAYSRCTSRSSVSCIWPRFGILTTMCFDGGF
jgi:hypothetical protein